MAAIPAPYNLEMSEDCLNCRARRDGFFCNLPPEALRSLGSVSYATSYPEGAMLCLEGHMPRGVYVLCRGRAKLSMVSGEGKTLILRIAAAGDALGLSACMLGRSHMITVETLTPCQVNFVRREDFLRFIHRHPDATYRVAQFLSQEYQFACREVGALGLAHSAAQKVARMLLSWADCSSNGRPGITIKLTLTHEEMAQMIGASRETVTRMLARFRNRDYIEIHGATLLLRDRAALERLAGPGGRAQGLVRKLQTATDGSAGHSAESGGGRLVDSLLHREGVMTQVLAYACEICGMRKNDEEWFLVGEDAWSERLRILGWNWARAAHAGMHHLCCAAHVEIFVGHWIMTGNCDYQTFAWLAYGKTLLTQSSCANGEREGESRLGELTIDRSSLRELSQTPQMIRTILDVLGMVLKNGAEERTCVAEDVATPTFEA